MLCFVVGAWGVGGIGAAAAAKQRTQRSSRRENGGDGCRAVLRCLPVSLARALVVKPASFGLEGDGCELSMWAVGCLMTVVKKTLASPCPCFLFPRRDLGSWGNTAVQPAAAVCGGQRTEDREAGEPC